jgi:hypothetical protein
MSSSPTPKQVAADVAAIDVAGLRAELDEQVERNGRILQLARHNGFEIRTRPLPGTKSLRLWFVPKEFVAIAGYEAAVVPA